MEFLANYSAPVVLGICLCVGYILKNVISTDKINKYIPLILGVLGVGVNCWVQLDFTPDVLLTGLFSGLASTGLHQAFKAFIDKFGKKKDAKEVTEE